MSSPPYKPRAVVAEVATDADLDGVAKTLGLAFEDDPVWSWAFAVPERGPQALHALWRFLVASALDYGWVWRAEGCAAAALWIPPGKSEIKPEDEERFESLAEELVGDGPHGCSRPGSASTAPTRSSSCSSPTTT
jgi:hypothetical protein